MVSNYKKLHVSESMIPKNLKASPQMVFNYKKLHVSESMIPKERKFKIILTALSMKYGATYYGRHTIN